MVLFLFVTTMGRAISSRGEVVGSGEKGSCAGGLKGECEDMELKGGGEDAESVGISRSLVLCGVCADYFIRAGPQGNLEDTIEGAGCGRTAEPPCES